MFSILCFFDKISPPGPTIGRFHQLFSFFAEIFEFEVDFVLCYAAVSTSPWCKCHGGVMRNQQSPYIFPGFMQKHNSLVMLTQGSHFFLPRTLILLILLSVSLYFPVSSLSHLRICLSQVSSSGYTISSTTFLNIFGCTIAQSGNSCLKSVLGLGNFMELQSCLVSSKWLSLQELLLKFKFKNYY